MFCSLFKLWGCLVCIVCLRWALFKVCFRHQQEVKVYSVRVLCGWTSLRYSRSSFAPLQYKSDIIMFV